MAAPKGAGDLRDSIRFARRGALIDDYGNETGPAFEYIGGKRSAKITPTRGGEEVQAGRLAGKASFDIWIRKPRASLDVNSGDVVIDARDASRVFNIRFGPEDMDGDGKWLLIQAEQGVAV